MLFHMSCICRVSFVDLSVHNQSIVFSVYVRLQRRSRLIKLMWIVGSHMYNDAMALLATSDESEKVEGLVVCLRVASAAYDASAALASVRCGSRTRHLV